MKKKMSTKKKIAVILTVVLIGALAIGGAMAWTDYTQSALNTFNVDSYPEVLLHDDFDGENKDVYVENTGSIDIYVRVKFVEYLQIGEESLLPAFTSDGSTPAQNADPSDKTTWPTHRFKDTTQANVCDLVSHDYFTWNMSGAKKTYLAGVNGLGGLSQTDFDAMNVGDSITIGDVVTTKCETMEQSNLMMLYDWLMMSERSEEPCWLLDTDGWAYWSAPLQGNTATNLLLDEVITNEEEFYDQSVYHIDVQLQAATLNDLDKWASDGPADVANPDNSVATVTSNGQNFITCMKGEDVTYEWRVLSNNIYEEFAINHINNSETSTGTYKLAGNDGNIETEEDNNMLAGRSVANNGGIEIGTIDVTNKTYTIKNADADYVVTMGIDEMLGTYDDVITSESGALGKYQINSATAENVGWNYLYGPLDNMLVATEYVLDNVKFNNTQNTSGYIYANSNVFTKMQTLWNTFGMDTNIVKEVTNLDMDHTGFNGKQVWICSTGHTTHSDSSCTTYNLGSYSSTVATQSNINLSTLSTPTRFFALSLEEIYEAYGEPVGGQTFTAPYNDVQRYRTARYTSVYTGSYKDTTWSDGVVRTHYWLRSPGYFGSRAAHVTGNGLFGALNNVTNADVGVRPACYLNLTSN